MFINEKTASIHVSDILSKLGVTNRGDALHALQLGPVELVVGRPRGRQGRR